MTLKANDPTMNATLGLHGLDKLLPGYGIDVKKNADAKVTYTLDRENHIEAASEIWATQPITQFIQQHGKQETRPKK